ncbi:hypothetical protein Peur_059054 [Populus x canadensis]
MSLLGSFVFGRENDGLFGSRLLGRARMPVRGLASGRSWCLVRYDFAPFFAPISAFSQFLCIGFFGSFFFSFFPLFSLDSSSFWCGCSVIDCIFDFSGLGIQQLIGFFGLLIVLACCFSQIAAKTHPCCKDSPFVLVILLLRELGIGIVVYSPLGQGFFSSGPKLVENLSEGDFRNVATVLSLTWVHHQGDDVCPIPETTKIENFSQNVGALSVKLSPEEMDELELIATVDAVKGDRYDGSM